MQQAPDFITTEAWASLDDTAQQAVWELVTEAARHRGEAAQALTDLRVAQRELDRLRDVATRMSERVQALNRRLREQRQTTPSRMAAERQLRSPAAAEADSPIVPIADDEAPTMWD